MCGGALNISKAKTWNTRVIQNDVICLKIPDKCTFVFFSKVLSCAKLLVLNLLRVTGLFYTFTYTKLWLYITRAASCMKTFFNMAILVCFNMCMLLNVKIYYIVTHKIFSQIWKMLQCLLFKAIIMIGTLWTEKTICKYISHTVSTGDWSQGPLGYSSFLYKILSYLHVIYTQSLYT